MQGKEFNKPLLSKELWVIFMPFVAVPGNIIQILTKTLKNIVRAMRSIIMLTD